MDKVRLKAKCVAMLLSGGLLFGTGTCIPDNFWVDKWGEVINTTIMGVYDAYVLTPLTGFTF